MVGLVIVSHSRSLAKSLVDLIKQVSVENIPVSIAAGVGHERTEFGTDAVEIMEAIQSVYSSDGVIVMMDLGSAVLSSQMALDLLEPEMAKNIKFCAAPLVEGSIAASVQIGLGSDLQTVYTEAVRSLQGKNEQLGIDDSSSKTSPTVEITSFEPAQIRTLTLTNLHGLHARPAARFIKTASSFDAEVQVKNITNNKGPVSAKSLNALATLGAVKDHQVEISASGAQAVQVLDAIEKLISQNFYESDTAEVSAKISDDVSTAPTQHPEAKQLFLGTAVSEGIALGPLFQFSQTAPKISDDKIKDVDNEIERLKQAIDNVSKAIDDRRKQLQKTIGEEQAAIFDAHLLILNDPAILDAVQELIKNKQVNASSAFNQVIQNVANAYQDLSDTYLKQRAIDVHDVGNQVLWELSGSTKSQIPKFEKPVIFFAENITPTDTAQLDMEKVLAIVTVGGGPTSHAAILARGLGIPAIAGANPLIGNLDAEDQIAVDGFSGEIWINPKETKKKELLKRREDWLKERQRFLKSSHEMAKLKDGKRIEIAANVGNLADAAAAVKNGAEGIGLLRTEFLFLSRKTAPSEDEQYEALCSIGAQMKELPVIVRTLDVGGDKELPYIDMPQDENPFLGVRAIRLSFTQPELFLQQLRAILRAAANYTFRIMFPMVANLDEVIQAKSYLEKAHRQLLADDIPHKYPIETGIMIEIPSAALLSNVLAPHVDFFSIGTNDLTQYTLAAERGNPALSNLSDALHPAVLRLIQYVVESAHHHGKWVGVCGELAGDALAAPILVGLGVDELSMNSGSIPYIKDVLKQLDVKAAQDWASDVLATESAPAARQIARSLLAGLKS